MVPLSGSALGADALRKRDEVREVVVAMTAPIPDYAREVLGSAKVRAEGVSLLDPESIGTCFR